MILVDTSVWIDHLNRLNTRLSEALERGEVLTHPFVVGELACGNLRARREVIGLLQALPQAPVGSDEEALMLIEKRRLMGKGLSLIDVHLLTSALLSADVVLWTNDKRLASVAKELRVSG